LKKYFKFGVYKLLFVLFLFTQTSCDRSVVKGDVLSEGIIEYDITYPVLDTGLLGVNMLPSIMTLTFKNDRYKVEISSAMGTISMGFISDGSAEKLDYYLKIINQRFISRFNSKGIRHLNQRFPAYNLVPADTMKEIAGYDCKGYKVHYFSNFAPDHMVYFTDNIRIKNPNWCTPYPKISGILFSYRMQYEGLVMHLEARKVKAIEVKDSDFNLPTDYKVIANPQIVRRLEELFSSI
jgi:hypothetical protein